MSNVHRIVQRLVKHSVKAYPTRIHVWVIVHLDASVQVELFLIWDKINNVSNRKIVLVIIEAIIINLEIRLPSIVMNGKSRIGRKELYERARI